MQTRDKKKAAAASGLTDRRTKQHIEERLLRDQTLADRPRSGRPRKYTDQVLKYAYQLLAEDDTQGYNAEELMQALCDASHLNEPGDTGQLLKQLKEYTKLQGHVLDTHATGDIFLITPARAKERARWCRDMLELIKSHPLENWWFEDETQISERYHHKGEALMNNQVEVDSAFHRHMQLNYSCSCFT